MDAGVGQAWHPRSVPGQQSQSQPRGLWDQAEVGGAGETSTGSGGTGAPRGTLYAAAPLPRLTQALRIRKLQNLLFPLR